MDIDSADLYRTIVETSPDGIWVIDLDGRTLYANPEIARIHRRAGRRAGCPRRSTTRSTRWAARSSRRTSSRSAGAAPTRPRSRCSGSASDGTTTWTLCRETPLLDADGLPYALLHRHTPYDERRALIASLREHEEALADEVSQNHLLQAVASAANEATTMTDVLRHSRDMVLLHDDWERARAFVPTGPDGPGLVVFRLPESPTARTTRRSWRSSRPWPSGASPPATWSGTSRSSAGVPGPARARGVRRHRDHVGAAPLAVRPDRDDGPPGRPAAGAGRRAGAVAGPARAGARRGDGVLPAQVRVPRDHEPRDPDAR